MDHPYRQKGIQVVILEDRTGGIAVQVDEVILIRIQVYSSDSKFSTTVLKAFLVCVDQFAYYFSLNLYFLIH